MIVRVGVEKKCGKKMRDEFHSLGKQSDAGKITTRDKRVEKINMSINM